MSDLLNEPGHVCSCAFCDDVSLWALGPILEHISWRRATFVSRERQIARNHLARIVTSTYADLGLPIPDHLTRQDTAA